MRQHSVRVSLVWWCFVRDLFVTFSPAGARRCYSRQDLSGENPKEDPSPEMVLPPLNSEVLGHDADDTIDAEQLINGGTRIRRVASEDGFTTSYHIQPATHEAYVQEREARTRYDRIVEWLRQQFWDGTLVAHFIQKGMKPVQSTQWSSATFFGTAVGHGIHPDRCVHRPKGLFR